MTVFCPPRATMNWSVAAVSALTKSSSTGARITFERRREISAWRYSPASAASRRSVEAMTAASNARMQIKAQDEGVEEVLNEIEATFALGIILEIANNNSLAYQEARHCVRDARKASQDME